MKKLEDHFLPFALLHSIIYDFIYIICIYVCLIDFVAEQ